MLDLILSSLYLILPAYFANMAPLLATKLNLPFGNPINKKALGKNKTYRGFIFGYIAALIILIIQAYFEKQGLFTNHTIIKYSYLMAPFYAFLLGIGALTGDTIKSFLKRKFNKKPGSSWPPFDQIDFILGAYIFLSPFFCIPWEVLLTLLIITPLLHFLANVIAYLIGLKKVWW